jgi:uncharacterized protein (DUF1015 family)
MKILPFRAVAPDLDKVPHSNDFFDTVKYRYHEYAAEGLFKPTEQEAMYIYQIKDAEGVKRNGLVVLTDINEYFNGAMRPHEVTIVTNEELQIDLLQTRSSAIKPILLAYPELEELDDLMENYIENHKKFYVIELGKEKHRFWQVIDAGVQQQLQDILSEKMPHAYIADGHHRAASFATLHQNAPTDKTSKMLCAYFSETSLKIRPFNRVVTDLNGLTADDLLDQLRKVFKIKVLRESAIPYIKFEMTMYLDSQWFQLNWRKETLKHFPEAGVKLDVHLLNEIILKPHLGITDLRTDSRLKYIDGLHGNKKLEEAAGADGVAFSMFPVEFEDLQETVDAQGILPPKSTFIEPRMKNGLLVYEI